MASSTKQTYQRTHYLFICTYPYHIQTEAELQAAMSNVKEESAKLASDVAKVRADREKLLREKAKLQAEKERTELVGKDLERRSAEVHEMAQVCVLVHFVYYVRTYMYIVYACFCLLQTLIDVVDTLSAFACTCCCCE